MHFVSSSSSQRDCKVKIADAIGSQVLAKPNVTPTFVAVLSVVVEPEVASCDQREGI